MSGMLGDIIRRRKAEQRTNRRAQKAQAQAAHEHLLKIQIPKERKVRRKRKALIREERCQAQRKQRNQHEKHNKQHAGQHKYRRDPVLFTIHRRFHPFRIHNVR